MADRPQLRLRPMHEHNGHDESDDEVNTVSVEELTRRTYNMVLETKAEVAETKGHVLRHDARINELPILLKAHDEKDDSRHEEVKSLVASVKTELSARIAAERASKREIREKLDSVSDEIEDTKRHNLKKLQEKAARPGKIALWAGRIAGGVIVVVATHWGLTKLESCNANTGTGGKTTSTTTSPAKE